MDVRKSFIPQYDTQANFLSVSQLLCWYHDTLSERLGTTRLQTSLGHSCLIFDSRSIMK